MAPALACVTGATGFLGSMLVKQLLERGYVVRAAVRCPPDSARLKHLRKVAETTPGTLEVYQADLLDPGSFDKAVEGVQYVFHVASPFMFPDTDHQKLLIDPALDGTKNVLTAVGRHKSTIKRVVLTSSAAAVHDCHCKQKPKHGDRYTEDDWNTTSDIETEAYWVSKVLAERAAYEIAQEQGFDLVTICPEFILGPALSSVDPGISISFMKSFLEGPVPVGSWTISDVRDVALAHILAAETPAATGRYIISSSSSLPAKTISEVLQQHLPDFDIPSGKDAPITSIMDSSKVQRHLQLQLTDPQVTICDMVDSLIELGIGQPKRK